jgi:hypothetical protein
MDSRTFREEKWDQGSEDLKEEENVYKSHPNPMSKKTIALEIEEMRAEYYQPLSFERLSSERGFEKRGR